MQTDKNPSFVDLLSVDSTNKVAHVYAKAGVPSGFAVSAKLQTGGYGSRGRNWCSPLGNLYMSTVWRQGMIGQATPSVMVMIATLSVFDTLRAVGVNRDMHIKWPNDILICTKKVSGILIEHVMEGQFSAYAVIGIGINLSTPPEDNTTLPAICLKSVCPTLPSRTKLKQELLQNMWRLFDLWRECPEKITRHYHHFLYKRGETISISVRKETIKGRLIGINKDGALILETIKGTEKLYSGDILVTRKI